MDKPGEERPQPKGSRHAGERNGDGASEPLADDIHAELHADDEHVERQSQLGDGKEITLRIAGGLAFIPREQPRLGFRHQQTEQGGPQQDARDHLGHHLGLAKLYCHQPHQPAENEDHRQLQEKVDGEVKIVHFKDLNEMTENGNTLSLSA